MIPCDIRKCDYGRFFILNILSFGIQICFGFGNGLSALIYVGWYEYMVTVHTCSFLLKAHGPWLMAGRSAAIKKAGPLDRL